jgi:photosystem II stability/assembly factor-like uncharacterized protein
VLALTLAGRQPVAGTDDGIFVWSGEGPAADPASPAAGAWSRLRTVSGGLDLHPRVADVVVLPDRSPGAIEGPRGVLMAATGQGLLRSTDAGRSWSRLALGLARPVTALAAVPGEPRAVLAATPLGVYESRDAGATWTQVSPALAQVVIHSLAFLPKSDTVLFATTARGLYRSADRGRTWHRCAGGLPLSDITGLALHPDGRTAFASDFGRGGVFRSLDGGDTWTPLPTQGLASDRVYSLVLDPSSERLVAASPTGGLHLLPLDRPPGVNAGAP